MAVTPARPRAPHRCNHNHGGRRAKNGTPRNGHELDWVPATVYVQVERDNHQGNAERANRVPSRKLPRVTPAEPTAHSANSLGGMEDTEFRTHAAVASPPRDRGLKLTGAKVGGGVGLCGVAMELSLIRFGPLAAGLQRALPLSHRWVRLKDETNNVVRANVSGRAF
jgi:hypothetical protein